MGAANHFEQSFTMQVHKVLEPVFARLGVYHESRNMALGALGTIQGAMAMGDIYGRDIDFLVWDSGMTEHNEEQFDLFMRQALVSGHRAPVLSGDRFDKYKDLHFLVDADICNLGYKQHHFPETKDFKQAFELPSAARYLRCSLEVEDLCQSNEYNTTCWIDRPDVIPPKPQIKETGGRGSFHPGFRFHQLKGRSYAFTILQTLRDALEIWRSFDGYAVTDDVWHMTSYYSNIRSKAQIVDSNALCVKSPVPDAFCFSAANGRTEFVPRTSPSQSSLRSIIKGPVSVEPEPNIYDPPDVDIPILHVPEGEVDYLNIVENGSRFTSSQTRTTAVVARMKPYKQEAMAVIGKPNYSPGTGWTLFSSTASDNCDGTFDSFCGRSKFSNCLLYGHQECRGGIYLNSASGWLVMGLENVSQGVIVMKGTSTNEKYGQFYCVGQGSTLDYQSDGILDDDFRFEYFINGNVSSWGLREFTERTFEATTAGTDVDAHGRPNFFQGRSTGRRTCHTDYWRRMTSLLTSTGSRESLLSTTRRLLSQARVHYCSTSITTTLRIN